MLLFFCLKKCCFIVHFLKLLETKFLQYLGRDMKKWRVVETTAFLIAVLALLWGGQGGCKKSNSPFGVNAPQGLDVPTPTPTPISGAIEVFVQDNLVAMQGVTVFIINPSGVTFGPSLTQPAVGMAPFNPSNVQPGVWTAFLPTQGVSFVEAQGSNVFTFNYYYYNSTQTFNVSSSGQNSVTFSAFDINTVSLAPVSCFYPTSSAVIPITAVYNYFGNVNVPVSISSLTNLPNGNYIIPTSFVLGEGVSFQPMTIVKPNCLPGDVPVSISAYDFSGITVNTSPMTLIHNNAIPVTFSYWFDSSGASCNGGGWTPCGTQHQCIVLSVNTSGDCGIGWNFSLDTGCGHEVSGTMYNGQQLSYPFGNNWIFQVTVWPSNSPVTWTWYGQLNDSGTVNIINTTLTN